MSEIKNCPWCGHKKSDYDEITCELYCPHCLRGVIGLEGDEESAISAWNALGRLYEERDGAVEMAFREGVQRWL